MNPLLSHSRKFLAGVVFPVVLLICFGVHPKFKAEATPNATTVIFARNGLYRVKILHSFETQRLIDCRVLDARDNWVKCNGNLYGLDGRVEEKFVAWLNADYISFVQDE